MKLSLSLLPIGYIVDGYCVRKDHDTIYVKRCGSYFVEKWEERWAVASCYKQDTYDDGRSLCEDQVFKHFIYYPDESSATAACDAIIAQVRR
jgi:hypothetical protein